MPARVAKTAVVVAVVAIFAWKIGKNFKRVSGIILIQRDSFGKWHLMRNKEKAREYNKLWWSRNPHKVQEYKNRAKLKPRKKNWTNKPVVEIILLEGEIIKKFGNNSISNFGRVFNQWGKQIQINITTKGNGYYYLKGKKRSRIIFELFKGPIPEGLVINHIDGIKTNDHIDNLEAVTMAENNQHARDTGLNNGWCKYSDELIKQAIEFILEGYDNRQISNKLGINKGTITDLRKRRYRKDIFEQYFPEFTRFGSKFYEYSKDLILSVLRDIRKDILSAKEIGQKYGISQGQILSIKKNTRWNGEKYKELRDLVNNE